MAVTPTDVACPVCDAPADKPCRRRDTGRRTPTHTARIRAALQIKD